MSFLLPGRWRYWLLIFVFLIPFNPVSAEIRISEVSPFSEPDWVEIVNTATGSAALDGLVLRDSSASNKKSLSGSLEPGSFLVIELANYLNKDGDTVTLAGADGTAIDSMTYDGRSACSQDQSHVLARRDWYGSFSEMTPPSPNSDNTSAAIVTCPTTVPTDKPTVTPKPSATPKSSATPRPAAPATAVPVIPSTAPPQVFVAVDEVIPEESEAVLTEEDEDNLTTVSGEVLSHATLASVAAEISPQVINLSNKVFNQKNRFLVVKIAAWISIFAGTLGFVSALPLFFNRLWHNNS